MQFDQSKIIETHLNKKPPSARRMVMFLFKAHQLLLPWLYIFVWTISTNLNI